MNIVEWTITEQRPVYVVDGREFRNKVDAERYVKMKSLQSVFVVFRRKNLMDLEVFSTLELAEDSLKHVPEAEKHNYKIIETKVDMFIR